MAANHLVDEKSPYLQQHAHNPVDWYPWGKTALEKARREDKPIFLSVGYSTCHWCHVMEHESFENPEIAAILNRHFVAVKVDREERPDIDRVYMAYVQTATGSGGWPMSVWLTPDGKPFVGGTYFPPEDRYGRPGFGTVLERIAQAWAEERERIVQSSARVLEELQRNAVLSKPAAGELRPELLDAGFAIWRRAFDRQLGGFGQAPKFPRPAILEFLLRYWARTRNQEALDMTVATLRAMSLGGMNDQLGGGFHRYSVDESWFVPHFEKMLYDQAQIASVLIEAFQITGDEWLRGEARRVFDYLLRDMTDAQGGFYSAEDADSAARADEPGHKSEGAFYIWSAQEIEEAAGERAAKYCGYRFGVDREGNVDQDPHGEFTGRNILYAAHTMEETAHHFDAPLEDVRREVEGATAKLLEARTNRPRPHLDDKILTSWNGLMISALARAGAVLDEPRYRNAARQAADFLRARMWNADLRVLLRRYRGGEAAIPGFLDDYAFFVQALLDLYETQFEWRDLELAIELTTRMRELFEDAGNGAFFSSAEAGGEDGLVMRMTDDYDGAEPSGNSVAALNLLRLERMTGRTDFGEAGRRILGAFASRIESQPFGVPLMMCALDLALSKPVEIVIAGEREAGDTRALLNEVRRRFLPNAITLLADERSREKLAEWNEAVAGMGKQEGRAAAYVCENFACRLPVTEPSKLAELLQ